MLWFVPAATFTVIVAVPSAFAVTVTVFPLTLTVATLVLLEVAEIAPLPLLVTVIAFVAFTDVSAAVVGLMLKLPAALPILQETVFAVIVPSLQR